MTIEEAEQVRHRACTSKRAYDTAGHARRAARGVPHQGRPVRHYRCPFGCGRWHVGHVMTLPTMRAHALAVRVLAQQRAIA